MIRNCGLNFELLCYFDYRDVIAHYAELTIINPAAFADDENNCVAEFFKEIDTVDERVILTDEDKAFEGISFVEMIPDLFDYHESIPLILMKNLKETKRDVGFSRRIMLAIKILHLISQNPGITTSELTKKVEGTSDRSVKRYIRSLQAAGILIEYENRGWTCMMDPREIF